MYVTTKDIAERLGVKQEYVTDKLTKRADFPAPVVNVSQRLRRWSRADFERWLTTARQCPRRIRGNRPARAA